MKNKGIVFGKGFLGTRISEYLGLKSVGREHNPVNYMALENFLSETKPEFVINAIGATGKPTSLTGKASVDWCETHKDETIESNVLVAANIGQACTKLGIYMVHLGSGCIYQGNNNGNGFNEGDLPNFYGPQFYAITKILAEKTLADTDALILRIRMPIDNRPHNRNLIDKLIGYEGVINIPNSMTTVPDMLPVLQDMINERATGIYNFVNYGLISAADIMEMYKEIIEPNHTFRIMSLQELDSVTLAKRSNCHLDTYKSCCFGYELPEIHVAVEQCLLKYKEAINERYYSSRR